MLTRAVLRHRRVETRHQTCGGSIGYGLGPRALLRNPGADDELNRSPDPKGSEKCVIETAAREADACKTVTGQGMIAVLSRRREESRGELSTSILQALLRT